MFFTNCGFIGDKTFSDGMEKAIVELESRVPVLRLIERATKSDATLEMVKEAMPKF